MNILGLLLLMPLLLLPSTSIAEKLFQVLEPPNSPSADFKTFRKQFILHNSNILFGKVKEQESTLRQLETTVNSVNNPSIISEKNDKYEITQGTVLNKGQVFVEVKTKHTILDNRLDALKMNYETNFTVNPIRLNHQYQFKNKTNNFGIVYSESW